MQCHYSAHWQRILGSKYAYTFPYLVFYYKECRCKQRKLCLLYFNFFMAFVLLDSKIINSEVHVGAKHEIFLCDIGSGNQYKCTGSLLLRPNCEPSLLPNAQCSSRSLCLPSCAMCPSCSPSQRYWNRPTPSIAVSFLFWEVQDETQEAFAVSKVPNKEGKQFWFGLFWFFFLTQCLS